jgi:hypothetical protein
MGELVDDTGEQAEGQQQQHLGSRTWPAGPTRRPGRQAANSRGHHEEEHAPSDPAGHHRCQVAVQPPARAGDAGQHQPGTAQRHRRRPRRRRGYRAVRGLDEELGGQQVADDARLQRGSEPPGQFIRRRRDRQQHRQPGRTRMLEQHSLTVPVRDHQTALARAMDDAGRELQTRRGRRGLTHRRPPNASMPGSRRSNDGPVQGTGMLAGVSAGKHPRYLCTLERSVVHTACLAAELAKHPDHPLLQSHSALRSG